MNFEKEPPSNEEYKRTEQEKQRNIDNTTTAESRVMKMQPPENINKPKKLSEKLPFLQQDSGDDRYGELFKEATRLMQEGKIEESIAVAEQMKGMKSRSANKKEFTEKQEHKFLEVRGDIVKNLGYKVLENEGTYLKLSKDGFLITLKHFMLPNYYGYENGRISVISINPEDRDIKDEGVFFDDGQFVEELEGQKTKALFSELVEYLN